MVKSRLSMCAVLATLMLCVSLHAMPAHADENQIPVRSGLLLAQNEGDDAYDPFADYSEFEESMDEEEDINFFRNGRLMTLGFIGGYRGWTGNLGQIQSGNAAFGLFLSYFFDLRFALQIGYLTSDHSLVVRDKTNLIVGNVSISDLSFLLKYYFNTQNVTRGLADLNPYLVAGFSQVYRSFSISAESNFSKDQAFGFNMGAGIELPMMRNKMFFGFQALYQLVNFANENSRFQTDDGSGKLFGPTLSGDSYLLVGVLGVNF